MNTTSQANSVSASQAATVWVKACAALKRELGEDTFGSWVAPASLLEAVDGALCVVTPTGIARDWIRRHAWRRLTEVWAENDPAGRHLDLKSRTEVEGFAAQPRAVSAEPAAIEAPVPAPAQARKPQGLQDRFAFDTFVQGPTNEFAYAVARRVASWADGHFNPVLFHGPFGFGKTHLLQALAAEAARARPDKTVIYLAADRFLSSFVKAVMERTTTAFKEELRAADLLIIDDVHFIGGKQATQEELFHTLAALMGDGRRVVMSADRAPAALTELEPRLRSHLASGLVCGIEASDRNHRLGILERKLELLCRQQGVGQLVIKPEVLVFLADRFTDSVRELEGALNTLVARAGAGLSQIGLEEAQAVIRPHLKAGEKRITVDDIQKATAEHFGLRQADLISERRTRSVARPRQAAMWLAKQLTVRSLPDIGRRFGGRDHTTVLHAVRRIEELRQNDAQLSGDLEALVRKLRG
jgi:chromosomal replication initiator protein